MHRPSSACVAFTTAWGMYCVACILVHAIALHIRDPLSENTRRHSMEWSYPHRSGKDWKHLAFFALPEVSAPMHMQMIAICMPFIRVHFFNKQYVYCVRAGRTQCCRRSGLCLLQHRPGPRRGRGPRNNIFWRRVFRTGNVFAELHHA
jgi:hypothetical protein